MQLSDREKVSCAAHTLKKDAKIWWEVVKQTREVNQMTWAEFELVFDEKFYNEAVLTAKVSEFTKLQQGNLLVAEYVRTFDQLAKFAPDLVNTEISRVNRFLEVLQPELARDVDMGRTGPLSYAQAVEKALRAEHREEKITKAKAASSMPRRDTPFNKEQSRFHNDNKRGSQNFQFRQGQNKKFKGELHDYEVILGMDWLSKYNATIDCRKKTMIFKPSKEDEFMFIGRTSKSCIPLISVMKARQLLESGCMGYLANVVDTYKEQKLKPEDVPVVRDFLEVFPEDLPGFPPNREIEFVIELLPANVVADALSRKSHGNVSFLRKLTRPLQEDMCRAEIEVIIGRLSVMTIQSTLLESIKQGQCEDPYLEEQKGELESGKVNEFSVSCNGMLKFKERVCVPNDEGLKREILTEAHNTLYSIPKWKWEEIAMDFVVGFPKTSKQHDAIWVIVYRYTKSTHFLLVRMTYTMDQWAELYVQKIVRLHGVPVSIISDRDARFTSLFWESLQRALGTKLKFTTAYHPQSDGQSERTIQTLEDMSRQKSYVDRKRRDVEFNIGDKVAYRLALPPSLSNFHDVFHVSLLRKYVPDPSHVLNYEPIEVEQDLTYEEKPVKILDRKEKELRNKNISLVKVLWRSSNIEEMTWEREDEMRSKYPELFG
ncbi:uncharacterized protein LOC133799942 [Humulus lupulus]|uniref:uncharacterized protein LOC133799942 n=1 Tax=Humulus lupulus TaxID=3486 RepID=UPI002B408CE3|nr:uncharacterized protein LOC133799942 [Humulus lupulus]